jgi:DNA-binding transcriptional MerR regulator
MGIVKPYVDAKGRGKSRIYSFENVKQIRIAFVLMDCGISHRNIGDVLKSWNDLDELLMKALDLKHLYRSLFKGRTE